MHNIPLEECVVSQFTVNKIFNHIPKRTLLALATEKVIEWYSFQEGGRGIHRTYRLENLYQIAIATQLSLTGFSYANIKELVMDKYFNGNDAEGIPKIYQYMPKLLGVKLGEATFIRDKIEGTKHRHSEDIRTNFLVLKGKSKFAERRIVLYEIIFDDPENINTFILKLNESISIDHHSPRKHYNQIQPISILVINLSELALRLRQKLESALRGSR